MPNNITIELCTADQARIDKLIDRLEAVANLTAALIDKNTTPTVSVTDDLTKKLQEVVDRAKTPAEPVEAPTPTTTPIKEETPKAVEVNEPTERKYSRTELGTKVRELMTKGFREQVKAIIQSYAPTVPGVPEDKLTECYEKLVALEG